ncbi:MAG: enoyl-CoA hydratase/isomerase family protein [Planctomycetaceae bacterium]
MQPETQVELTSTEQEIFRIRFSSEGGIQILSEEVCRQLGQLLKVVAKRPPRILVFEATGRTFLAGAELRELAALDRRAARRYSRRGQKLFRKIAELPCLTVAAIHAPCAGGGCEMSLACDFRFLADTARIGLPEVTLGIIPGWGGAARALRVLGPVAARRLILSGELLPAAEALQIGLADAVFPAAEFPAAVDARLKRLLRCAPGAVASAKRFLSEGHHLDLTDLLVEESRLFGRCYAGDEPAEGIAAFLNKRDAVWPTLEAKRNPPEKGTDESAESVES